MKWKFAASLLLRRWGQDKRREGSKKIVLAAGVAAITAVDLSHAATITVKPLSNGSTAVFVVGKFEYEDAERFEITTASLSKVFVTFYSPGGNAYAGITNGKVIHHSGFNTCVGAGATCASACAVAWLGGARRVATIRSAIGFHASFFGPVPKHGKSATAMQSSAPT